MHVTRGKHADHYRTGTVPPRYPKRQASDGTTDRCAHSCRRRSMRTRWKRDRDSQATEQGSLLGNRKLRLTLAVSQAKFSFRHRGHRTGVPVLCVPAPPRCLFTSTVGVSRSCPWLRFEALHGASFTGKVFMHAAQSARPSAQSRYQRGNGVPPAALQRARYSRSDQCVFQVLPLI